MKPTFLSEEQIVLLLTYCEESWKIPKNPLYMLVETLT